MFAFQLNFSSFNTIGQGSPVISHTPAAKEGTICMFVFVCACMCMYVCVHMLMCIYKCLHVCTLYCTCVCVWCVYAYMKCACNSVIHTLYFLYFLFCVGLNMSGVTNHHSQLTRFSSPAQIDPFYTQGYIKLTQ